MDFYGEVILAQPSQDRRITVYTNARVLPCTDKTVIEDGSVVVGGEHIEWVGRTEAIPAQYQSPEITCADVGGATIMPGLVDGHLHISFGEAQSEEELSLYTPVEYRAIRASVDAEKALLAGVTSACDPGGPYRVALAVRDAVEAGLVQGPRFACAGRQITSQQGIPDNFPDWLGFPQSSFGVLVHTKDEIVREIRDEVKAGVDLIKIAGSGVSSNEFAAFRLDELELAADEAHRLDRPITIHARSRQSIEFAAKANYDWIMHASYIDEPTIEDVASRGIPILPAMTLLVNTLEAATPEVLGEGADRIKKEIDAAVSGLSAAHKAGVTLIAGSESGFAMTPYGFWHAREMALFVEFLGLSNFDALLCGTRNAALTLPKHREMIGTLEPGKFADLLVVDGNPDEDVTILQNRNAIETVVKAGEVVTPWRPLIAPRRRHRFENVHLYTSGVFAPTVD